MSTSTTSVPSPVLECCAARRLSVVPPQVIGIGEQRRAVAVSGEEPPEGGAALGRQIRTLTNQHPHHIHPGTKLVSQLPIVDSSYIIYCT